jgi:hypothetical protein
MTALKYLSFVNFPAVSNSNSFEKEPHSLVHCLQMLRYMSSQFNHTSMRVIKLKFYNLTDDQLPSLGRIFSPIYKKSASAIMLQGRTISAVFSLKQIKKVNVSDNSLCI